jgi:D-alanyl-D-alanine dipeptidase
VQFQLWDHVKGTDQQQYVADPKIGSIHNYGFAVDLTILDAEGRELDMGTAFDEFTPLAEPRREEEFLRQGRLTALHLENRLLLRRVMEGAEFTTLAIEWWHFDALPKSEVIGKYPRVE